MLILLASRVFSDERVVGLIRLHTAELRHHCGPVGEIQEFVVAPEYRGIGAGRSLMDAVKAQAKKRGILSLEVTTSRRRVENLAMYESLGFVLSHNKFTSDWMAELIPESGYLGCDS